MGEQEENDKQGESMNNIEKYASINIMGLWSPFYEGVYKGRSYCLETRRFMLCN